MPVLDGHGAAMQMGRLMDEGVCKRTPIIALTASVGHDEQERCRQSGMVAAFAKPLRPHTITSILEILQRTTDEAPLSDGAA